MTTAPLLVLSSLCSLGGHLGFVIPGVPFVVARATSDTILAIPGSRPVYGQVFVIKRAGGFGHQLGMAAGTRVVLVPWAYGPDCRPTPWTGPARFVNPDQDHFFQAQVRDRSQWINATVTMDLHGLQPRSTGGRWGGLSPDQAFDLVETLPSLDDLTRNGMKSLERVKQWARAHPDLADRPTVRAMFSSQARAAEKHRLGTSQLPVHGTWDVRITLPAGREVRTWIRTASVPVSVGGLSFWGVDPTPLPDPWSYRARGYSIHFWNAPDSGGLPPAGIPARAARNWPWEVATHDSAVGAGRSTSAMLEIGSTTWTEEVDAELAELMLAYEQRVGQEISQRKPYVAPVGRFIESDNGTVRYEQVVPIDSTRTLTIRAHRVSRQTVAGDGYPRP